MRRRRDPFARESYIPQRTTGGTCSWCGQSPIRYHRLYTIRVESDGGRDYTLQGQFDSWTCAETYHNGRIGR
jgi:hypothetical protein